MSVVLEITGSHGRYRARAAVNLDNGTWDLRGGNKRIARHGRGYFETGREWVFWDQHHNGGVALFAFRLYSMIPLVDTLRPGRSGQGQVLWDVTTPEPRDNMLWRVL